jgi:hypothetical protein
MDYYQFGADAEPKYVLNYTTRSTGAVAPAVPEPSSNLLLAFGAFAVFRRRR